MSDGAPFDPRGLANLFLEVAERNGIPMTNLALQKLLYFAHGMHLKDTGEPLVTGYFEAWTYGPVHPVVYQAFKSAGDKPIDFKAQQVEIVSGLESEVPPPEAPKIKSLVMRILSLFQGVTPGRLIDIAHAKNSPWDVIANKSETSLAFGDRIPNNLIRERFQHHKISVTPTPKHGEPGEDSPITRN